MITRSKIPKALIIGDRGYESYNTLAPIQEKGSLNNSLVSLVCLHVNFSVKCLSNWHSFGSSTPLIIPLLLSILIKKN